ncbi:transmembrane protein 243-like [Bolinopsis microptera]|uniref:transmembrane protein 243-like n=1 Tax=Bolinopsis microptera TaxID=2820187 RepID=UPI00307A97CA
MYNETDSLRDDLGVRDSISSNISAPLFGEANPQTRYLQWALAIFTIVLAGTTLIVACTVGTEHNIGLHVFMSLTLIGLTITTFILALWYEEGDLHPKFLYILYSQTILLLMFSILLFIYFGMEKKR